MSVCQVSGLLDVSMVHGWLLSKMLEALHCPGRNRSTGGQAFVHFVLTDFGEESQIARDVLVIETGPLQTVARTAVKSETFRISWGPLRRCRIASTRNQRILWRCSWRAQHKDFFKTIALCSFAATWCNCGLFWLSFEQRSHTITYDHACFNNFQ